jgi:UDP-N-acetylmuramoyl-tripeptide--D-alanyl-D-alanine ligase
MMNLSDIAALLENPSLPCHYDPDMELTGISIDSRTIKPGNLFVAIRGESFDGDDFVSKAVKSGAIAVVCSRRDNTVNVPQWVVPNTVDALAQIATLHRQRHSCPVIALTGSNGKTTVKEMIAAILPKPSHATMGNLNNHLGVPLSVLGLNSTHRAAVFELGANHPFEILHTVSIVKPQVTLINNIAPAHIAGFGSIEGVASAKGEIYQGLALNGTAVINEDDAFAHFWDPILIGKKTLRFSIDKACDVHAREVSFNTDGCARFCLVTADAKAWVELKVPGVHNVKNALAAAACTLAIGVPVSDIASALSTFAGVSGRMTYHYCKNNTLIIDDTYNANLSSTLSAIDVLAHQKGHRIFVFGDMGELGDLCQQHHEAVGEAARERGIDMVLTCGSQSHVTASIFGKTGKHYSDQKSLLQDLLTHMKEHTTVLVKGSRSSAMELVVHGLIAGNERGE